MTIEDNVAVFNLFRDSGTGGADAFLFLASLTAALVFFTYDAEGRVISFKDEVIVGAAAEELVGAFSSGVTDAVTLVGSSGTTSLVALSLSSGAITSFALAVS
jgi:hypothetical protein